MKPIKLEIDGLNSYATKQVVDFESLTSRGLFGIFGKTGSGKSTILDAITLSLYGNIARGTKEFINSNHEKASIDYEFELGESGERTLYRVSRRFKRNKANGNSLSDYARLLKKSSSGEYEILADKKTDVDKKIKEIIGLQESDFLRSVVLPQGKFSEFLTLAGAERRSMLERIFGLEEYGTELSKKIYKRRGKLFGEMEILQARLSEYPNINIEEKNNLEKEIEGLKKEIELLEASKIDENKKYEEFKEVFDLLEEKEKIEKTLELLLENRERIEELSDKLELSDRAMILKPEIDKLKDLKEKVRSLDKEKEELNIEVSKLEENLKEINIEFKEIEAKKNEMSFIISTKKDMENILEEKEKQLRDLENMSKVEESIRILQEKKLSVEEKLLEISVKEKDLAKEIESIEKSISENKVDEEYRSLIYDGKLLFRELEKNSDKTYEYEKRISSQNNLIKENEEEVKILEDKLSEVKETLRKTLQAISKEEDTDGIDDDTLEKMSEELHLLEKEASRLSDLTVSKKRLQEENIDLNKAKEVIEDKLLKLESTISDIEIKIGKHSKIDSEASIEKLSSQIKEIWSENFHKGDICPVCNNSVEKIELNEYIEDGYNKNKKILEELEESLKIEIVKKAELNSDIKNICKNIEENNVKILEIEKAYGEISLESLSDKINNLKESRKKAKLFIEEKKDRLIKLNEKKEILKEVENSLLIEKNKILSDNNAKKESIEDLNKDLKAIYEEKTAINSRISDIKNKILKEIGEKLVVDKEFFKGEYEKISKSLELLGNLEAEKEKNIKNLKSLQEEEKDIKTDLINLEKEIAIKKSELEGIDKAIKSRSEEISEKEDNVDLERLKNIVELDCKLEDRFIGILDTFIRVVEENYNETRKYLEEEAKNIESIYRKIENNKTLLEYENKALLKQLSKLDLLLEENKFENDKEIEKYCLDDREIEKYKLDIENYKESLSENKIKLKNINEKLLSRTVSKEEKDAQLEILNKILEKLDLLKEELTKAIYKLDKLENDLRVVEDILKEQEKKSKIMDSIKELEKIFKGNRFVEYLSQIYLKNIVFDASKRLDSITNGRYSLEINSEYLFVIRDNFNGGIRRSADTLSGGEIFLTSLSLALALSSQIQLKGSAPLEFFFLDEGFGTLDSDLLETVIESLEKLSSDTLSVGIISHVDEIKTRIPMKLEVEMDESISSSIITQVLD